MIDIIDAIRALDPNTTAGVSQNDINKIDWHDGNPKKLTIGQIQSKYDELVEADKKLQYQRDRAVAYPPLADQMDLLYHGGLDALKAELKKTKDKFPKP